MAKLTSATSLPDVCDTARWVAAHRAIESARSDRLFVDPFAARLAGERGRSIAKRLPWWARTNTAWSSVVRTHLIDELVLSSIRNGSDRVVNLAAGLDTRPYRLDLPATLRWVEADLPDIVKEKERVL